MGGLLRVRSTKLLVENTSPGNGGSSKSGPSSPCGGLHRLAVGRAKGEAPIHSHHAFLAEPHLVDTADGLDDLRLRDPQGLLDHQAGRAAAPRPAQATAMTGGCRYRFLSSPADSMTG